MIHALSVPLTLLACLVAWIAAYSLLVRLIRTLLSFVDEAIEVAVALFFFVVIVPPVWIWQRSRRPMWRTLTQQQSQELRAWLQRQ